MWWNKENEEHFIFHVWVSPVMCWSEANPPLFLQCICCFFSFLLFALTCSPLFTSGSAVEEWLPTPWSYYCLATAQLVPLSSLLAVSILDWSAHKTEDETAFCFQIKLLRQLKVWLFFYFCFYFNFDLGAFGKLQREVILGVERSL